MVTVVAVVVVTVRNLTGLIELAEFGGCQWFANSFNCAWFQPTECVDVT